MTLHELTVGIDEHHGVAYPNMHLAADQLVRAQMVAWRADPRGKLQPQVLLEFKVRADQPARERALPRGHCGGPSDSLAWNGNRLPGGLVIRDRT